MADQPRTPATRATARAWFVTLGTFAVAIAITTVVAGWPATALTTTPRVHWLVIAGAMALAERYRLHLHFARETHSFTLGELPTALALFFLSPVAVILARALGGGLALATLHWRNPLKFVFNVGNNTLEAAVSVLVFWSIAPSAGAGDSALFGAVLVAVMAGSTVGIGTVWLIIRSFEGHRGLAELVTSLRFGWAIGLANAGVALCMAVVIRAQPELLWVPFVPLGVLFIAYRAYSGQWQRRDALDFLYEAAVEAQSSSDVNGSLLTLVRRGSEQLKASAAELVAMPAANATTALVVSVGEHTQQVASRPVSELPPDTRELISSGSMTDEHLGRDDVWVRASVPSGGVLLLRCRNPIGNAASFDALDLEVLRSLSRVLVTTVERAELAELKSAFLSAVSHELRTPLTSVLGIAVLLNSRSGELSHAQTSQLTTRLDAQARRLDRLLTDLLDLDRLERGSINARRQRVDLVAMTRRVVDTLDIEDHRVTVPRHDPMVADLDPALTERIIANLVKNAAKYSPAGTEITIGLARRDNGIAITVEDEGLGIPEDRRASVMEPFVRLDHAHPKPGTGIGLTLVRRFAQLHGGEVTIDQGARGGARVTVVLPDGLGENVRELVGALSTAV